jgi:hypothetical protein
LRLKLFFMMVDDNKNGDITLDELTKFLQEQQKQAKGGVHRVGVPRGQTTERPKSVVEKKALAGRDPSAARTSGK